STAGGPATASRPGRWGPLPSGSRAPTLTRPRATPRGLPRRTPAASPSAWATAASGSSPRAAAAPPGGQPSPLRPATWSAVTSDAGARGPRPVMGAGGGRFCPPSPPALVEATFARASPPPPRRLPGPAAAGAVRLGGAAHRHDHGRSHVQGQARAL